MKPNILYVCAIFLGLIIAILLYRPLINKISEASDSLSTLKSELLDKQTAIAALKDSNVKGDIIQQDEVSMAIAEIAEKGRKLGLNFSSISPSQLHQTTEAGIQKLPIRFIMESEYNNFGQFLAYIEELSGTIAAIETISIYPCKDSPSGLSIELILNLYVKGENET
ncbi:MAG: type 4a pilus biogenesis protein PilO [Sedimentisphaerales bacterium]|nr:type 4a pilus biogenesis protein PilO [Sedimentisphaerales bacterium]